MFPWTHPSNERSYAHGFLPPSHKIFGTECLHGCLMRGSTADRHKNRVCIAISLTMVISSKSCRMVRPIRHRQKKGTVGDDRMFANSSFQRYVCAMSRNYTQ